MPWHLRLAPLLLMLALAIAACRSDKPSSEGQDLGAEPPREAAAAEEGEAPDRERSEDIDGAESSSPPSESTVKSATADAPKPNAKPESPCGCAPGDLMCSMRCAQQGGSQPAPTPSPAPESAPSPTPTPAPGLKPASAANKCGCAPGDLMCSMRCAQK